MGKFTNKNLKKIQNRISKTFIILINFFFFYSCEYKREFEIPIDVIKSEKLYDYNSYEVKKYFLQNVRENFNSSKWNRGLICEGYSDRPNKLLWISYNTLSKRKKDSLNYFLQMLDECGTKLSEDIWVSACITDYLVGGKRQQFVFHVVYVLDLSQSLLFEIRDHGT